jgi:hypothetical protein
MTRAKLYDLWIYDGKRKDGADSSSMLCLHDAMCGDGKTPQGCLMESGAYLAKTFVARNWNQAKKIARAFEEMNDCTN